MVSVFQHITPGEDTEMAFDKMLPIIVTDRLDATRDFYIDALGWTLVDKMDGYLQVRAGGVDTDPELAFLAPQPAQGPLGTRAPFTTGLVISIPVGDADAHRTMLQQRGVTAPAPTDKPWGWRSFLVDDPGGVTLDFWSVIAHDPAQDASS